MSFVVAVIVVHEGERKGSGKTTDISHPTVSSTTTQSATTHRLVNRVEHVK
jgi:hypothetical protein